MMRQLAFALLLPLTAFAQLALVTFDGTTESAVGSVYDFGKIATGDTKDVRFRARNNGTNAVPLTTLTVSGTAPSERHWLLKWNRCEPSDVSSFGSTRGRVGNTT